MRLHYAAGHRGQVKQTYEELSVILQRELSAGPLPETTAVYESMLAGEYGNQPPVAIPEFDVEGLPAPQQAGPPFVGRVAELRWLDEGMRATVAAQGCIYFLQGESGVGKTRLIAEWLERLDVHALVLSCQGHEFESMIPYGLTVQALRRAAPIIPWQLFYPPPPWLATLQPLVPDLQSFFPGQRIRPPGAAGNYHVVEALRDFIFTLARKQPLVFFLDNLHLADAPTWNFLGYLAQRISLTRIMVIGIARTEDMPADRQRLVRRLTSEEKVKLHTLDRLSQAETEDLVGLLMPDLFVDPRFLRRIYEETEGNPFFIVETIKAVREAGGDWTESVPTDAAGHRPFFAIPLQVQAVIESRLDLLSHESRSALGVAAAIGREFSFELLQEVSQFDTAALLDYLDDWLARGLVRETPEGYDFTHEKLSQVAYGWLSRARRQWIHLQVAEHLRAQRPDLDPAQLAHHFYLSNEPGRALPYLAKAGERALTVRSYAEAREFGLRAIGLLGRYPGPPEAGVAERIDINLQLAQAHAFTGAHNRALEILQETESMAETLGDVKRLARIFHRSAQVFWLRGQAAIARDYTRRTLRHAEEFDFTELRFAALRMLGRTGIVLSSYDDAIAFLLRYIDLAGQGGPRADLPAIYGYLAVAYARVGSWQRAIAAAQQGLEMASKQLSGAMHVVARMQLAFVYAELYEWEQAMSIAEPVRDLWREEGMTPHAFMLRIVIGRCLAHLGEATHGPAEIQAALQWAEDVDYRVLVHVSYLYLALAQYHVGEYELARGTAIKAAAMSAAAGNRWAEAVARRTMAEAAIRLPKPDWPQIEGRLIEAINTLRQIRARPDLARTFLAMRRLYDRAGQVAWAVDCHFRATTIFDELGMEEERKAAQGQPAGDRTGAAVISGMRLRGPLPR
jgi:tetratricopeptide (TPR) repeat protein